MECRDVECLEVSLTLQLELSRGVFRGIEQSRCADVIGAGVACECQFPPGTACNRFGMQWPGQFLPVRLQVKAGFGRGEINVAPHPQSCGLFRHGQLQCLNVQLRRLQFSIERCVNTVALCIPAVAGAADMQLLERSCKASTVLIRNAGQSLLIAASALSCNATVPSICGVSRTSIRVSSV